YMEGGDGSTINRIVHGASPADETAGPMAVVHCGEGSLEDCEQEFTNAVSFAASDALSQSEASRPVTQLIQSSSWAELGIDRNFDAPVGVVLARLQADDMMEDNATCFERTQELEQMSAITEDFRKELPEIQRTCRTNVYVLDATAVRACYDRFTD